MKTPILAAVVGCSLIAALIGIAPTKAQPKAAGAKYALVIGIDEYEDSKRLPKLQFAEADAQALHDLLKAKGFQTTLLLGKDASKTKIEEVTRRILKKGIGTDTLLLAFSGHGQQFKPPGGKEVEPFLCTRDCNALDSTTQVAFNQILTEAGDSKFGKTLFLVDACRVDPDPNKGGLDGNSVKLKAQTVALFAASNGQKAREHGDAGGKGNGHGIFMSEVLRVLGGESKNEDGTITWKDLDAQIARSVTKKSKQLFPNLPEDQHQTPHSLGSFVGDAVIIEAVAAVDEKQPKPGEERSFETADGVKMIFCWIPAGKATLGSPEKEKYRGDGEKEHEVETKGFWLAKYACTQKEYEFLMGQNPSAFSAAGYEKEKVKGLETDRFPVEEVSWDHAQAFLKKVNARGNGAKVFGKSGKFVLPHEDQWEYACRGGKGNGQPFYWGDSLNGDKANCKGDSPYGTETKGESLKRTTEVGSYSKVAPHPWGLCDMAGNVYQWCNNWNDSSEKYRVCRGGAWHIHPMSCRAAHRTDYDPGYRSDTIGFRVCFVLD